MEGRKTLKIDLDELCSALEDGSYEHDYYLNLETGGILFIPDYMGDEEADKLRDRIDEDPERYEQIPKGDPHKGYEDMEDFIANVDDEHLAELLEVAINGKGDFHRFKDVLAHYPEERERWFRFKDERMRQRAFEWLDDISISPVEE